MQLTERTEEIEAEVNPPTADERMDQAREIVREAASTSPETWERYFDDGRPDTPHAGDKTITLEDLLHFAERKGGPRIDQEALKELKAELAPKADKTGDEPTGRQEGRLEGLRGTLGDPPSAPKPLPDIEADQTLTRLNTGFANLRGFEQRLGAEIAQWRQLRNIDPVSAARLGPEIDAKVRQWRELTNHMMAEGRQMEERLQRSSAHAVFGHSNPSKAELEPLLKFAASLGLTQGQVREISLKPRWARAFAAAYRASTGQEIRQPQKGKRSRIPERGAVEAALQRLEGKHAKRARR